ASAMVNTMQQVGGSIGTALLSTLAAGATTTYVRVHHAAGRAVIAKGAIHGYTVAFFTSAAIFLAGAVVAAALLNGRPARASAVVPEAVPV
ncbi:MAG: MFS transporter, partial [Actinomycetota bacterium]|nr:MFS transporter [Actinomycetota bacterium]